MARAGIQIIKNGYFHEQIVFYKILELKQIRF